MADAKKDLRTNSPLQANQSYANLSIDVIRTETGVVTNRTPSISQVQLTCVVSADIIQYCDELPQVIAQYNQPISLDNISINMDDSSEMGSQEHIDNLDSTMNPVGQTNRIPTLGEKAWEDIKNEGVWDRTRLWYAIKEDSFNTDYTWVKCRIIDAYNKSWKIEYLTESNKRKRKWVEQSSPLIAPRFDD